MTYNQANRLATASSGAGPLSQFTYDAFGQRIVKVGSATATSLFQYDGTGQLLEESDGTGAARVDYVYLGDRPVATIQPSNGRTYFLEDDRLGTPQLATDSGQAVQWSATYQPFGYTATGAGAIVQDLRLPGQEWDLETGLYRNGFRDYVPGLGRYLESDPVGLAAGLNTYGYAFGNPIVLTDPSGKVVPILLVIGAAVGGVSGAITTGNTVGWSWSNFWIIAGGAGIGAVAGAGGALVIGGELIGLASGIVISGAGGFLGDVAGQWYAKGSLNCIDWREARFQGLIGLGAGALGAIPAILTPSFLLVQGIYSGAFTLGLETVSPTNLGGFGFADHGR